MPRATQHELQLARRMSRLGTETAFEVLNKARALERQGKSIIHLEIGEPDFDTPSNVIEAGAKALRGGWTGRQLERQIGSQFYERTALSKNKATVLARGAASRAEDSDTAEQELKDPFVLEFLDLKDEYSETDLEEALIQRFDSSRPSAMISSVTLGAPAW